MPSAVRSPLKSMGSWVLSLPQNLTVGKPWMSTPATSFSVESTLMRRMLGLLASLRAASSQWGTRVLQWPHQGAQNLTSTSWVDSSTICLKFDPTTTFTFSSLLSGTGADFRNCCNSPDWARATKLARLSAVMESASNLNFSVLSLRKSTVGVFSVLTPRYSASLSNSPWPSFLEETVRMTEGEVASQALRAYSAADSAESSPMKRKSAALFCWKIFSMAELSKGRTAADSSTRRTDKTINFIFKSDKQILTFHQQLQQRPKHVGVIDNTHAYAPHSHRPSLRPASPAPSPRLPPRPTPPPPPPQTLPTKNRQLPMGVQPHRRPHT